MDEHLRVRVPLGQVHISALAVCIRVLREVWFLLSCNHVWMLPW